MLSSTGDPDLIPEVRQLCFKIHNHQQILPFGKKVHVAILSSIPATIGSYQKQRGREELKNKWQLSLSWKSQVPDDSMHTIINIKVNRANKSSQNY